MASDRNAYNDPFFLTLVVLYSATIGVALTSFPPTRQPLTFVDVLLAATLVQFVTLIALTYAHAAVVATYTVNLFLLKAFIAIVFAWAFRLLDTAKQATGESMSWALICYYFSFVLIVPTMLLFVRWTRDDMTESARAVAHRRYNLLRGLSLSAVTVAAVVEATAPHVALSASALRYARPAAAWSLLLMSILYFRSRPWSRFVGGTDTGGRDVESRASTETASARST